MSKEPQKAGKETKISGFVEEVEQEDGTPGVRIFDGDNEYLVIMDKQSKRLLDLIDEEVEVTGVVNKNHGVRQLKISRFRVLDDYEDDDADDQRDHYNDDDFFNNDDEKGFA